MGEVNYIGVRSELMRRVMEFEGHELLEIAFECADILGDDSLERYEPAALGVVNAACDAAIDASENELEQVIAMSVGIQSLIATLLTWIDEINLRSEIAEIENGM